MPEDLTIKQLVEQSFENSAAHGFWSNERTDETIPSKLMLIVSELGEALESYRDPDADQVVKVPVALVDRLVRGDTSSPEYYGARRELDELYLKWQTKPKGFAMELADAFIRLGDLCGSLGIDIEKEIQNKHEYNKGRPHRHGRLV